MGNFLEDFFFGTPNPQTGETDGGIPAVADALWPFENTFVSNVYDNTAMKFFVTPKVPQVAAAAGLTALEAVFSYGLYRPASTLLQAGAAGGQYDSATDTFSGLNPLYRDGVQLQDFVDMWNASEYITPGRALAMWSWYEGGYGDMPIRNPGIDSSALGMIQALNNPYPTAGGLSREQYENAWDESALGTLVSGSLDTTLGLIGIPGAGGLLGKAKSAAGLQATVRNTRDLAAMRKGIENHATWVASQGAEGKWNVSGKHVQDLAQETDLMRIRENPLLGNYTRSGSFNQDRLADIISKTDDPATIAELVLADRGDTLALGRLFQAAPDHVWSLTDMNERLAAQFSRGGQYFPSQDTTRIIQTTFDTALERDEWWTAVRDTFMSGTIDDGMSLVDNVVEDTVAVAGGRRIPATSSRAQEITKLEADLSRVQREAAQAIDESGEMINPKVRQLDAEAMRIEREIDRLKSEAPRQDEFAAAVGETPVVEPGKLNAVRGEGSDFMPLGTVGSTPLANATGMAQSWLRSVMADARLNRPNTYVEIPLAPAGFKPVTKLMFWASGRQPLNVVSYTNLRPAEVVEEMLAYSRSSRSLRKGLWTVSRKDPKTGEPIQVQLRDWQWRAQAVERLVQAKTRGDLPLDTVVDDLQRELISVIVNRYALSAMDGEKAAAAINDWLKVAQEQVARDGFFLDDAASRVIVDARVARQLPSSRVLMPLDDLDWYLRGMSEASVATRGRGTRRIIRFAEGGLDTFFKLFRTNVLFKPGYTPKNSFAEPAVSAILADGSLLATGGLRKTLRRFDVNNDRRLLRARYGVVDFLPYSAARRDAKKANELANEYATTLERLNELDQHIADLANSSPVTQSKYLEAALAERRILNKQLTAAERELSIADPAWAEVVEVPTYSELSDRVTALRTALQSEDFPATAQSRIDELLAMGAERVQLGSGRQALLDRIEELQARRAQLIKTRDSLATRAGRRATERDLKNPAKNKRQDLLDPENPDARTAPDPIESQARSLDTVYDYDLKKFVKRDVSSNSRKPARDASNRRAEAVIRSISYIDEQLEATRAAIRAGDRAKVFREDGLTAVEASEVEQLRALLAARDINNGAASVPRGNQMILNSLGTSARGTVDAKLIPSMRARFDEMRAKYPDLFASRDGAERLDRPNIGSGDGGDWYVLPERKTEYLERYYADYLPELKPETEIVLYKGITEDSGLSLGVKRGTDGELDLFGDAGATRVAPSGGSWWTFDPEVAKRFAGGYQSSGTGKVAEIRMTWQEYVDYRATLPAKRTFAPDPFDHMSGVAEGGWIEWAVKLDYTKIPASWKARVKITEASGGGKGDAAAKLIDDLSRQLDEIREATYTLQPDARSRAEALRARLAELDQQSATLNGRIAKRRLVRDRLMRRELSGEEDIVLDVGGVKYTIPGPFSTTDNFGAALRAESSADLSMAQQATGGVNPLGITASRGLGARFARTGAGEQVLPTDVRYWDELAYSYNRHVLNDDFAKLILAGKSDAEIMKWFRTKTGQRYAKAMGWSKDDLTGGPSGTVAARPLGVESTTDARITVYTEGIIAETRRLLNQYFPDAAVRQRLLKGEESTAAELQAAMGARDDLAPIYGTGLQLIGNPWAKANLAINNALDTIWRNLATKPETRFARWPFMTREYKRQMERSIALRQDQGLPVTGTDIAAMRQQAYARAIKETENSFYNIRRMANPVFALRYITAFASAAWNTLYRYGRLAYRRPGTAMVVAWGWQNALTTIGVDQDGNKVDKWNDATNIIISLPDWVDLPIDPNLKLSTETFNFATQESGFTPAISIAAGTILRYKPELDTWLKENHPDVHEELFGYGTNTDPKISAWGIPLDPLFGGWQLKGLTLAKGQLGMSDDDFIKSAHLDLNYRMFEWQRGGQQGPMPTFEDSAKNARDFYLTSLGISAMTSGVSGISPVGQFYRDELYKIREKHPDDYAAYQAEAYSTFGPEVWHMIQSTTSSRSAMPPTADALDILRSNEGLAKDLLNMSTDDPKLTVDLLFLDEMTYSEDAYSEAVYNYQFRTSLPGDDEPIKSVDTQVDIEREIKKAQSWAIWNASVAAKDAALMQMGEKRLLETGPTAALYAQWKAFEEDFVNDRNNSLMVEELGLRNTGKTAIALRALQTAITNREWMKQVQASPTWKAIRGYMTELSDAKQQYEALETTADRRAFAAQWDSYVRDMYLPGAGNFAGYYERRLAGRDLTGGQQMLERTFDIPGFPLPETS